jgi:hypothetical protein
MTTRRVALAALAAFVLAGAGAGAWTAWRRAGPPPTDEALVRALLADAARAAGEKRPGAVVDALSEAFRGPGGMDREEARRVVVGAVLRGGWVSASIGGVALAIDGDVGRANVDVVLARGTGAGKALAALLPGEASVHRFGLALAREPDGWRVVLASWRPVKLSDALEGPPPPDALGEGAAARAGRAAQDDER